MSALLNAAQEALRSGWSVGVAPLEGLRREAALLRWDEQSNRAGGGVLDVLAPVTPDRARPGSMSAQIGRAAQPLHTDGAHLDNPPRFVLLHMTGTNDVPTRLWNFGLRPVAPSILTSLEHGVFVVRNGPASFLAHAMSGAFLRVDPACMEPGDYRARDVARFFQERTSDAVDHQWDEPDKFVLIDNHKALHARGDATQSEGRSLTRLAFQPSVEKVR